jgi:hypothetical protein
MIVAMYQWDVVDEALSSELNGARPPLSEYTTRRMTDVVAGLETAAKGAHY